MITGAILLLVGILIGYFFAPRAGVIKEKVYQKLGLNQAEIVDLEDPLKKFEDDN